MRSGMKPNSTCLYARPEQRSQSAGKQAVLLATFGFLAACGSSTPPVSYTSLEDEFVRIDAQFDRFEIGEITDPASLPVNVEITYNGVFGADIPETDGSTTNLLGDVTVAADFGTDTISGTVDKFRDNLGGEYSGTLAIDNGVIDSSVNPRTTFTYLADIGGSISQDSAGSYDFDGVLQGDFFGIDNEFVAGRADVDVTTPSGTVSLNGDNTFFVGER